MHLIALQDALQAYLTGESNHPPSELLEQLQGSAALGAADGLRIYHNAYRTRLLAVLREDFPALQQWLGVESFEQLALAYLSAWPPRHFSLRWLGEKLPEFIAGYVSEPQLSPLRELATLEWAFTLAFDARDADPLSAASMSSFSAKDWIDLTAALVPSANWLQLQYNTLELWKATKEGEPLPPLTRLPDECSCLVWRHDLLCRYRSLEPDEATALRSFAAGESFAGLCESLFARYAEQAPMQAAVWLRQWVSEGLLTRT
ncbi:DNA-binding domain-containing protein [Pseudomonas sp. OTU5201]|uniref:DNA-binding domain-containing protein n=1 Tax=Pseudomonas sp. OTU5201 TaxID=3043850 RepID=UPI00313DF65C